MPVECTRPQEGPAQSRMPIDDILPRLRAFHHLNAKTQAEGNAVFDELQKHQGEAGKLTPNEVLVHELIKTSPGLTDTEVAERLGLGLFIVKKGITKLSNKGISIRFPEIRRMVYSAIQVGEPFAKKRIFNTAPATEGQVLDEPDLTLEPSLDSRRQMRADKEPQSRKRNGK